MAMVIPYVCPGNTVLVPFTTLLCGQYYLTTRAILPYTGGSKYYLLYFLFITGAFFFFIDEPMGWLLDEKRPFPVDKFFDFWQV
jgi:hypothetical protein